MIGKKYWWLKIFIKRLVLIDDPEWLLAAEKWNKQGAIHVILHKVVSREFPFDPRWGLTTITAKNFLGSKKACAMPRLYFNIEIFNHCFSWQLTCALFTTRNSATISCGWNWILAYSGLEVVFTPHFEALKSLWFYKCKLMFTLLDEMLKFSKSSAYFHKFVHTLMNKTVNKRIQMSSLIMRTLN